MTINGTSQTTASDGTITGVLLAAGPSSGYINYPFSVSATNFQTITGSINVESGNAPNPYVIDPCYIGLGGFGMKPSSGYACGCKTNIFPADGMPCCNTPLPNTLTLGDTLYGPITLTNISGDPNNGFWTGTRTVTFEAWCCCPEASVTIVYQLFYQTGVPECVLSIVWGQSGTHIVFPLCCFSSRT